MISEIANSLFLTYLASEYLVAPSTPSTSQRSSRSRNRTIQQGEDDSKNKSNNRGTNVALIGILALLTGTANLIDHHFYLSVAWNYSTAFFANHLPSIPSNAIVIPTKLFLAASSYVTALYFDIHRDRSNNSKTKQEKPSPKMPFRSIFLPKVGWAFLKILPAYPFLAVLISFVFLFVVDFWEYVLHLPLEWLNNPIYYGTLYGPFAYTYVHVKKEVLRKTTFNHYPSSSGIALGGSYAAKNDAFV